MRLTTLRTGLLAAAALAAASVIAWAQSQSPVGLRGAQDAEPTVQGQIKLEPPKLVLEKPANVTRIRAIRRDTRPSALVIGALKTLDQPQTVQAVGPPVLDAEAAVPLRRLAPDDDPYGALGYRAGSFLLRPSIEVDFGYDDNPGRQPGKVKGAAFTTLSPRFEFQSDWSRHELRGTVETGFTRYFGLDDDRPQVNAVIDGRIDVSRDTTLEAETRFNLDTERLGDDGVPTNATKRPVVLEYGATLGVTQRFGPASLRLRGSIDQNDYDDSLPCDCLVPEVSRDYTTYGLALRAGYDLSPAVQPFVEISGDMRRHRDEVSSDGLRRDSDGAAIRAGAVLDLTGTLKGEASLGYGGRRYDDPSLPSLSGMLADASLVWTPSALTTITLRATTAFDETVSTDSSGALAHTVGVEIAHAFRRNLIATASLAGTIEDYDGIDRRETTIDAQLGLEYRLSRSVAVRASYAYEHLASTVPGSDYTANTVLVGLRLQH